MRPAGLFYPDLSEHAHVAAPVFRDVPAVYAAGRRTGHGPRMTPVAPAAGAAGQRSAAQARYLPVAIAAFALVTIAATWAGVAWTVRTEHERAIADAMTATANLARTFEEHTLRSLSYIDQIALRIKAQCEERGFSGDLEQFLQSMAINPAIVAGVRISNDLDMEIAGVPASRPVFAGGRDEVRSHRQEDSGKLLIGRPVDGGDGRLQVPVTRRINKPGGGYGGVVTIYIDPVYFSNFYRDVDLGKDGAVALMGRDGVVRARLSAEGAGVGQDIGQREEFRRMVSEQIGSLLVPSPVDDLPRIVSFRALRDYPLLVGVGISAETALAGSERRKQYYVGAAGLVSTFVLMVALWLMWMTRRLAHAAGHLRQSEQRLSLALEGADMAFFDWNVADGTVQASEHWARMLGLLPQSMHIDMASFAALVHPEDQGPVRQHLREVLAGRVARYRAEYRMHMPDGKWLWVQSHGFVVARNKAGRALRMAGVFADISWRKQAEQDMREAQQFLDSILENIPAMIFVKDVRDLRFVRFNRAGEELIGRPRGELIGKNDYDLFSRDQANFFTAKDRAVIASGEILDVPEEPINTQHGLRYLHTRKLPIPDESGQPRYLLGISEDITDHRAAELSLRISEAQLRAVINHSSALIALQDAGGRFLLVNQPYAAVLHTVPEAINGKPLAAVLPPELAQRTLGQIRTVFATRAPLTEEVRLPSASGVRVYMMNKFPLLDASGLPYAVGSIYTDITQRERDIELIRRINRQLEQQAAELTTANKELESFAYSVSHDLRAPLRHISGFVNMLREQAGGSLDETARRYLERIAVAATRMAALIDDLLALSRTARAELRKMPVALGELVQSIIDELQPQISGRTVRWEIGALPVVHADRSLLRQAFFNLMDNALKYSRTRPEAVIGIDARTEDGHTVIRVSDNGVGFDMAYAGKLFGVFQRLHRSEEFEGTGIGLANVARIIQRHGGRVWAESREQQGAVFFVALPQGQAEEQSEDSLD